MDTKYKATGIEIWMCSAGNMDTFVKLSHTLSAHDHNKFASPPRPLLWNSLKVIFYLITNSILRILTEMLYLSGTSCPTLLLTEFP